MKVSIFLICLVTLAIANTIASPVTIEEIDPLLEQEEILIPGMSAEDYIRIKRSGVSNLLGAIASKLSSGITTKFGQASAGASSLLSGSSGGGGHEEPHEHYGPPPHEEKAFDIWAIKKSILNTLFQAVKAITGVGTIIGGKLIKGGGAAISGTGKVVSFGGDAISSLGKTIATSAKLVPHYGLSGHGAAPSGPSGHSSGYATGPEVEVTHSHHVSHSYGPPPTSYGPPSGAAHSSGVVSSHNSFSIPSSPGTSYGAPMSPGHSSFEAPIGSYLPQKLSLPLEAHHQTIPKTKLPEGVQAGLLILKPIGKLETTVKHGNVDVGSTFGLLTAPSGPSYDYKGSSQQATKETSLAGAVDALKGIIGSLSTPHTAPESHHEEYPSKPPTEHEGYPPFAPSPSSHSSKPSSSYEVDPSKDPPSYNNPTPQDHEYKLTQHDIPQDLPGFKPLEPLSTLNVPPVDFQMQYGPSFNNHFDQNVALLQNLNHNSLPTYGTPFPNFPLPGKMSLADQYMWQQMTQLRPPSLNPHPNFNPNNVFNTMSQKYNGIDYPINSYGLPNLNSRSGQKRSAQKTIQKPSFDIQKSIQYELKVPDVSVKQ